jgi:hypothetical protein
MESSNKQARVVKSPVEFLLVEQVSKYLLLGHLSQKMAKEKISTVFS